MNKNILKVALGIGSFLILASWPAQAGFYFGVRGGLSNQNAKAGQIEFPKDSSVLYGAQLGFKFLSFAVEGQFYRADHNFLSDDPMLMLPGGKQEMNYYYLGVNGKLGIPLVIVYPYITGGYGRYSVDLKGLSKSSDSAFNIGAGAELTLGKVGLFAELRYTDFSIDVLSLAWDFGGLDIHAGLNIHF
ncbi:MAG: outer membrane beta-barrel protein [Acidobacteriota bacterium]